MTPAAYPLDNPLKNYAWGSHDVLATLRGESAPSRDPEAELWMGTHPSAPSAVMSGADRVPLPQLLSAAPEAMLGPDVVREFGSDLPFLLKLLAAAEPLSLQAHPNLAQAQSGFAREHAAGIPIDSRERSYRDRNHKPELIAALTPFHALVGFRATAATRRLFIELGVPELEPFTSALASGPEAAATRRFFELVTQTKGERGRALAEAVGEACLKGRTESGEFPGERSWGARIAELYPGDPSVILALGLNLVVLAPGEALFLPAGNLHAYLEGAGVEVMASSDNVLRGGLTPKHIDVPELLCILDFRPGPAELVRLERDGLETHYRTMAREFALSRFDLEAATAHVTALGGPEILVVTRGRAVLVRGETKLALRGGQSAFLPSRGGSYTLSGSATVFRARVNLA